MGVKYRVNYKDNFDNSCRIDISTAPYIGDPILLRGVGQKACVVDKDCGEDPYEAIVNTTLKISVYQTEDLPIDIMELQQAQDREFTVKLYINEELEFSGFMVPDGIQMSFLAAPFELNINATDGLKLLSGILFNATEITTKRCIINYFRDILFSESHLNLPLPIRWVNSLKNDNFPLEDDVFSGSVAWSNRGEGFIQDNGIHKDCMYILEGMLKSMQSRIVQSKGVWVIWRINDVSSGVFKHREVSASLGALVVVTSDVINEIKTIGGDDTFDYRFVEEDQILTINPALKTVTTKYEQDQRDNILPNGNMGIVVSGKPLYWTLDDPAHRATFSSQAGGLGGTDGYHVDIDNPSDGGDDVRFEYNNLYLPIDSDVLYSYINIGFKFSILRGYVLDGNGFIDWSSTPFRIRVWYFNGNQSFYLNENGFWTFIPNYIQITVPNLKPSDVAQIDFNAKQNIVLPVPIPSPIARDRKPSVYISFLIPKNREMLLDDVYINTDSNSDVYDATYNLGSNTGKEDYTLNISSSHNGFYVSNFMTNFDQSGFEKFYSDDKVSGVTLTEMNSHAIIRNRYKPSIVFEGSIYGKSYDYSKIYEIQTLTGKKFLPLRSSWNTETNIVNLNSVEIRNDGDNISVKHYGSNTQTQLSN